MSAFSLNSAGNDCCAGVTASPVGVFDVSGLAVPRAEVIAVAVALRVAPPVVYSIAAVT